MLSPTELAKMYKDARACLVPTKVAESFGLSMAEAMACGTPVIGFNNGSIPEVVAHNKTGFVVRDVAAMAKAIHKIDMIDRAACRSRVEKHFTRERMIDNYEKLFTQLTAHRYAKKN